MNPQGNVWMGGEGLAASQLPTFTRDGRCLPQIRRKGRHKGSDDPSRDSARAGPGRVACPARRRRRDAHRCYEALRGRLTSNTGRRG